MLHTFFESLFGCSHPRTTFPMTERGRKLGARMAAVSNRTYVVCLDCGKEFDYDWKSMRVGRPVEEPPVAAAAPHTIVGSSAQV
jgi:hypothetical protein